MYVPHNSSCPHITRILHLWRILPGNGESSSQQRADSDIAALSAQMKSSFEPVINTMMDSFVDCKLRMLQSHTETIADKDLMYTTKVL